MEVKNDEFWDYDRQVDLEGFSTKQLYDTLSKQSRGVTQTIGQHKDNVKQMYQRIANQSESLKGRVLCADGCVWSSLKFVVVLALHQFYMVVVPTL